MEKIIWTKLAMQDVIDIEEYISKTSKLYAQRTIENFFKRLQILIDFPNVGRIVPEINKTKIKELIEGNYRIVYTTKSKQIFILRVHHAARLITKTTRLK